MQKIYHIFSVFFCLLLVSMVIPATASQANPLQNNSFKQIDLEQTYLMGGKFYHVDSDVAFSGFIVQKYDNGKLKARFIVKEGIPESYSEAWYENGAKFYEIPYDKGLKHGSFIAWHPNKKIGEVGEFKHGARHGAYMYLFDNGEIGEQGFYKNGKLDGTVTVWNRDGKKTKEVQFKDGVRGETTMWHGDGSVEVFTLVGGELHGTYKYWKGGTLVRQEYFKNGARQGKSETFYESNGKKHMEMVYDQGILQSIKIWNKKGELIKKGKREKRKLEERDSWYAGGTKKRN